MLKKEAKCLRKQEKAATQSQSHSSASMHPDQEEDHLDSGEWDASSRRVKSVIQVPPYRQSLAPLDTDVESPA